VAIDLVIFDLDGTLADTKLDLANAVNAARRKLRLPDLDNEVIYRYVGDGARMLVRRALGPGFSEEDVDRALEHFSRHYRDHLLDNTRLYPGVKESLERLKAHGVRMAVLTNKPVSFAEGVLQGLGVSDYFFRVLGGDSMEEKKPDPAGVALLPREAGVPAERALLVGDSSVDVLTARNAGIAVCGVTYGLQPESLASEVPDILVERMEDLADMVLADRGKKGAHEE